MNNVDSKKCPFGHGKCSRECGLFIDPNELNEVVRNKLASIGVIDREEGICSLKNLALCVNRIVYEDKAGFSK